MNFPIEPDSRELTIPTDLIAAMVQAGKLDDSLLVLLHLRDYYLSLTDCPAWGLTSMFTGPVRGDEGEYFFIVYADNKWDMRDFSVNVANGQLEFSDHMIRWEGLPYPKKHKFDLADPELVEKVRGWFGENRPWGAPETDWLAGTFENGPILFSNDSFLPDILRFLVGEWEAGQVTRNIRRRILAAMTPQSA
jgi:hypothetical protein